MVVGTGADAELRDARELCVHGAALEQEKCWGLTQQNFVSGGRGFSSRSLTGRFRLLAFLRRHFGSLVSPSWACLMRTEHMCGVGAFLLAGFG